MVEYSIDHKLVNKDVLRQEFERVRKKDKDSIIGEFSYDPWQGEAQVIYDVYVRVTCDICHVCPSDI